jgi:hypothetical protein
MLTEINDIKLLEALQLSRDNFQLMLKPLYIHTAPYYYSQEN